MVKFISSSTLMSPKGCNLNMKSVFHGSNVIAKLKDLVLFATKGHTICPQISGASKYVRKSYLSFIASLLTHQKSKQVIDF